LNRGAGGGERQGRDSEGEKPHAPIVRKPF
jgi:hypothetical protein